MAEIIVHVYGLVPGKFFDIQMSVDEPVNLAKIERKLVALLGDKIPPEYKTLDGLIDHKQAIPGASGKQFDYDTSDIAQLKEIWFIVPLAGG